MSIIKNFLGCILCSWLHSDYSRTLEPFTIRRHTKIGRVHACARRSNCVIVGLKFMTDCIYGNASQNSKVHHPCIITICISNQRFQRHCIKDSRLAGREFSSTLIRQHGVWQEYNDPGGQQTAAEKVGRQEIPGAPRQGEKGRPTKKMMGRYNCNR